MRGEKQNNIAQKLDGMEALPDGFAFEKWQAWQKMEPNLGRKKKRWLWLPAAAVLMGIGFTGYFIQYEPSKPLPTAVVTPSIHQPVTEKKMELAVVSDKPIQTAVKSKASLQAISDNPPASLPRKENKEDVKETNRVAINPSERKKASMVHLDPLEFDIKLLIKPTQPKTSALLPPDTATSVTAIVTSPPKPRFKIAHVNELYTQPTPVADETKKATAFSIRRTRAIATDEAAPLPDDNSSIQKKNRTFLFSSLSASQ